MDNDKFKSLVDEAIDLTNNVSDPYRIPAFQALLTVRLLNSVEIPIRTGRNGSKSVGGALLADKTSTFEEYAIQIPRDASHVDRFVAIAYWLLDSEGMQTFHVNELLDYYTRIHWLKPNNPADIANKCQSQGLLSSTGQKKDGNKEWKLTKPGIQHSESLIAEKVLNKPE